MTDTYAREVVVGFFDDAKRMRARAAGTVDTRIYEGVVRRHNRVLQAVQGEHIYARRKLVPDDGGVDARELFVVFAGNPRPA